MATRNNRGIARRVAVWMVALGSGGTLLSACESRFKDALVGGTKDYIGVILTSPDTANAVLTQLGFEIPGNTD